MGRGRRRRSLAGTKILAGFTVTAVGEDGVLSTGPLDDGRIGGTVGARESGEGAGGCGESVVEAVGEDLVLVARGAPVDFDVSTGIVAIDGPEGGAGGDPGVEAGGRGNLLCGFVGLPAIEKLVVDGHGLLLVA